MELTDNIEQANIDNINYRKFHESYMQNLNGTTALEVYFLIVPSFLNIFICTNLIYFVLPFFGLKITKLKQFFIEFIVIVVPVVFWVTVLSDYIRRIFLFLLIVSISILTYLFQFMQIVDLTKIKIETARRRFITNARSTINIITAICILAVDFQIFPRRFAKTETFGFGLMDVGVGLYVYSNGVVSSPFIKERHFLQTMGKTFLSCTPLFILGSVRFVLTNELDYQQHVSEYGVHWNFFMTLAMTKFLSTAIWYFTPANLSFTLTIALMVLHEYLLYSGLQDWVLSDVKRSTFLTANREGLVSSLGYVVIYFLAIQTSTFMNLKKTVTFRENLNLLYRLSVLSIFTLLMTITLEHIFGVSRRLTNSAYICWISFIALSMITFFLAVELCLSFICVGMKKYFELKRIYPVEFNEIISLVMESINFNGLTFFLLANVLTGLINLTIQTLTVDTVNSLFIIFAYIFVICASMCAAFVYNIKLKFW